MALFEAALPLLSPLDARKTIEVARDVFLSEDPPRYNLTLEPSSAELAGAVLRLSEAYRKNRIKELFEKIPADRRENSDVIGALSRYQLEFRLSLTESGIVQIHFDDDPKWTDKERRIARAELFFLLYHFVKDLLRVGRNQVGVHCLPIDYKESNCIMLDKPVPGDGIEYRLLQELMDATEYGRDMAISSLRQVAENVASWRRMMLPVDAVFGKKQAETIYTASLAYNTTKAATDTIAGFMLPLGSRQIDLQRAIASARASSGIDRFAKAADFLVQRFDGLTGIGSALISLFGITVALVTAQATGNLVATRHLWLHWGLIIVFALPLLVAYYRVAAQHGALLESHIEAVVPDPDDDLTTTG